uniref:Uncharacterized protein n=1 Tax=Callorhinchus milii TaxID=7868 RepID=A0A4W3K986_CALMI
NSATARVSDNCAYVCIGVSCNISRHRVSKRQHRASNCPFGTYGLGCRKTCQCMLDICDRETGRCLKFSFFEILEGKSGNRRKTSLQSGSASLLRNASFPSLTMKRLNPR